MKKVRNIMLIAGIIVILGTAGASDLGTIPIGQTLFQVVFGLILFVAGSYDLVREDRGISEKREAK